MLTVKKHIILAYKKVINFLNIFDDLAHFQMKDSALIRISRLNSMRHLLKILSHQL